MAQLVIKREPWWSTPFGRQVMIWVPVAGLQAATLAGLGYFYDRLAEAELYGGSGFADSSSDVSASAPANTRRHQPLVTVSVSSVPAVAPVSLQPALESGSAKHAMQAGESFAVSAPVPVIADVAAPVDDVAIVSHRDGPVIERQEHVPPSPPRVSTTVEKKKTVSKKQDVIKSSSDRDARRTAEANLAGISTTEPDKNEFVPVTHLPTANPDRPFNGALTPVGIVTWIYIGELRDYGWHGQKLHVAPHSGLPEIGRNYRTQKIHGLYEQPYGKRVMAGFQQGDTVTVLEVMQEANNKVWAKVRKVRSYGR